MPGIIVVGSQWGDEGKGKVVDVFSAQSDYVVRYQGGANAGHTLVVDGQKKVLLNKSKKESGMRCATQKV